MSFIGAHVDKAKRAGLTQPATSYSLLAPLVVSVFPRWSAASTVVSELPVDHALALAESETQAYNFREHWLDKDLPLLIFRCPPQTSVDVAAEAVSEIASRNPHRPVSVLLADGPEAPGFREDRRSDWNRKFAKALAGVILDVQVFEYASTWATVPPRIR